MQNLQLSFEVVAPICFTMLLGLFLRKIKLITENGVTFLNRLVFSLLLPLMLFFNISQAELSGILNIDLFIWVAVSVIVLFLLLYLFVPKFEKDKKKIPVIIQGVYRSNFVIFGIPVAASLYGGENVAVVALMVALVSPMFNIMAALVFAKYSSGRTTFAGILKNIITNPLVIGSLLGLFALFFHVSLPVFLEKPLAALGNSASTLGLLVLGAGFAIKKLQANARTLVFTVTGKLLLVPLIFLPLSILLGFRGVELIGLLVLYASPSALAGYTMATQVNADGELAGQVIVLSSLFSVVTVFFAVLLLKSAALI